MFIDRHDAARALGQTGVEAGTVVIALSRRGMTIAEDVSTQLSLPLDRRLFEVLADEAEPLERTSVLLVDDGFATDDFVLSAILRVRSLGAKRVSVAAPLGQAETVSRLHDDADNVVCLHTAEPFGDTCSYYRSA
jgi:putative phosphoribosyl transferase